MRWSCHLLKVFSLTLTAFLTIIENNWLQRVAAALVKDESYGREAVFCNRRGARSSGKRAGLPENLSLIHILSPLLQLSPGISQRLHLIWTKCISLIRKPRRPFWTKISWTCAGIPDSGIPVFSHWGWISGFYRTFPALWACFFQKKVEFYLSIL